MKLVVFTDHYPYGVGEDFLEDEIKIAENYFEEILIVTAEKMVDKVTKYVPENASVISVRANVSSVERMTGIVTSAFNYRFWKGFFGGLSERGLKSVIGIAKKTLLTVDYMRYLKKNEKHWKSCEADTVYYSYWLDVAATYLALNNKRLKGICVSRAHGGDCFFDRGYIPFRKAQLHGLDAIFTISDAGKVDILKHYTKDISKLDEKIFVSYLGIVIPDNVRLDFRCASTKTLVTCSNVIPLKRLDLLIEALALCENLNIKWFHFGDGSEMENIVSLAENKLSSKPNISFEFKGRVPNQDVLSFYNETKVDLFVNCSDTEGIPVSIMEAMARGIPAIARNVGANAELVDEDCGKLLPQSITAFELRKAIEDMLILDEEEYLCKRQNAVSKVANRFNAQQNYICFWKKLVEMGMSNE